MNSLVAVSQSGLVSSQFALNVLSSNLSNADTVGFGQSQSSIVSSAPRLARPANTVLQKTLLPSALVLGTGSHGEATQIHWSHGFQQTGIPTQLAIQGSGFFPVTTPNGTLAYTRAGDFTLNSQGHLTLPNGSKLVPPITIPPNTPWNISHHGIVTNTQTGKVLGFISLALFPNASGLSAIGGSLFQPNASSGPAQLVKPGIGQGGTLLTGALNTSGVNLSNVMTRVVAVQSTYLANAQALKVDQTVNQATVSL